MMKRVVARGLTIATVLAVGAVATTVAFGQDGAVDPAVSAVTAPVQPVPGVPAQPAPAVPAALAQPVASATAASSSPSYEALVPSRLMDGRTAGGTPDGLFAGSGVVAAGGTVELQVTGRGGVPADVSSVVLNVTATEARGTGFVTVWPCGQARPLASSLNFSVGRDVANAVVSRVGAGGKVCLYVGAAATQLVVDVNGYFPGAVLPGAVNVSGCRFLTVSSPSVPFCDTFDVAKGDPATRSGDLDPVIWGVSRTNTHTNISQGELNDFDPATLVGCGAPVKVLPPNDVRICNGRVVEAVNDGAGQPTLALYPKQPFDIAGRTGTVVFDVSADAQGGHAAWPEFWWTDQPVPAPHGTLSAQFPYARNSLGVSIALACGTTEVGVDKIIVTRNYREVELPFTQVGCVKKGSATGALNHFEIKINQNRVEVWAGDAGASTVELIAFADNAGLTLTKGLIWIEHVAYNACKFDTQCDHTIAWDNVGFDGPATYRDLSFDVPDNGAMRSNGTMSLGYRVGSSPLALTVNGVYRNQTPTGALATFNWFPTERRVPSFRVNGGPWHDTAWPFDDTTHGWRTIGVSIPVAEVRDGTNTIEFRSLGEDTLIANINLILVAGAPVPTS